MANNREAKLLSTTDAQVWAQEFMEVIKTVEITEGLMIVWFANAMATQERESSKKVGFGFNLDSLIFQALGAASTCWESLEGTGVFQSNRATEIGEDVLTTIRTGKVPEWYRE